MAKIYPCIQPNRKRGYKVGRAGVCYPTKKEAIETHREIAEVVLESFSPNAGIADNYRSTLLRLITAMALSLQKVTYTSNLTEARRYWEAQFKDKYAESFVDDVMGYADTRFAHILADAGRIVRFVPDDELLDAMIKKNVSLIKSIPSKYFDQVEAILKEGLEKNTSMDGIAELLHERYGITVRRARMIVEDQNGTITAEVVKLRQKQLGIVKAYWQHTNRAKEPRLEHVEASGETYNIHKGMFLEGEWVWPGSAINCRCISRSILP